MKLFSLLDLSYNVPYNDKYKEFIDVYKEELINIQKRNVAANALKKLYETNKAPLSDEYIYEHRLAGFGDVNRIVGGVVSGRGSSAPTSAWVSRLLRPATAGRTHLTGTRT